MRVSGLYAHVKKVSRCHYMSKQQFRSGLHPYDVIEYATHPSVITRVAKARNPLTRPSQHPLGCVFHCRVRPVRGERFDQLQRVLMKMASASRCDVLTVYERFLAYDDVILLDDGKLDQRIFVVFPQVRVDDEVCHRVHQPRDRSSGEKAPALTRRLIHHAGQPLLDLDQRDDLGLVEKVRRRVCGGLFLLGDADRRYPVSVLVRCRVARTAPTYNQ
jgi:hypothetical protein